MGFFSNRLKKLQCLTLYLRVWGSTRSSGLPFTLIKPLPVLQWATAVAVFWNRKWTWSIPNTNTLNEWMQHHQSLPDGDRLKLRVVPEYRYDESSVIPRFRYGTSIRVSSTSIWVRTSIVAGCGVGPSEYRFVMGFHPLNRLNIG
jgi:hypothetical protein